MCRYVGCAKRATSPRCIVSTVPTAVVSRCHAHNASVIYNVLMDAGVVTQLLETAAGKAAGDVGKQFDAAAANNLTVVRMFGFGTQGGFALQTSIGSYNEQAFQAFDKVSIM